MCIAEAHKGGLFVSFILYKTGKFTKWRRWRKLMLWKVKKKEYETEKEKSSDDPFLYNLLKYEDFLDCLNCSVPVTILTALMT